MMIKITHDELQPVIAQLNQAIYNHEQWLKAVNRTLTCRSLCDERDLNRNAHRKCLFGQWYYNYAPQKIREHPAFTAVEGEHRRMHELAAKVLSASAAGLPISPLDYDAMTNAVERMHLQIYTLKRELEDSVYKLDPLTGACNRLSMLTILREQQELVKRRVHECCITLMDLDHFKKVNDTYGHPAGDRVLATVASRVINNLRPYDAIFRYGGEEFLICILAANLTTGHDTVERLREEIASKPIDCNVKKALSVTASFGLTLLAPDVPVEQSIDCADKALLKAKSDGRNCTRVGDPSR